MPKRTDIKTILVIGSGPIVIGQGCEFDYSGTQACKALKQEGYRIVLVNSNPATIMTDPAFSDRTYIEPINAEAVRKIIELENSRAKQGLPGYARIDAVLPTLGGQTALNVACKLWDDGTLTEFGVEMIGANREIIHRAEDRQIFKDICEKIGLKLPKAKTVNDLDDALAFLQEIGLPAIIRPAFTLGGTGGGIAYNLEEYKEICTRGLAASMIGQIQIDQSVIGWKEYELEVVRDKKDNCIIVCGIENIDAMGVHTGDSITVAPILTLTDKEYQQMRDAAFAIMRAVGVETGGSNVQFGVNPNPKPGPDGTKPFEMVVIEMNPRVSRSSALASKATGFPIAKIAAKLAVGYTLDELKNDITGTTSACFEPTIDYVVTKMPRWTFEKFPDADETLTTQMKSVGEAMAIGRTFKESFQKVIRSMDIKRFGLGLDRNDKWLTAMRAVEHGQLMLDVMGDPRAPQAMAQSKTQPPSVDETSPTGLRTADGSPIEWPIPSDKLSRKLAVPSQGRLYYVRYAMKMGWSIEKIHALTHIDPFFLDQIQQLVQFEDILCNYRKLADVPAEVLFEAKQLGYSDAQLACLYLGKITPETILEVGEHRKLLGIKPVYKLVDTCAAEFEAVTPYYYSTYERSASSRNVAGTEAWHDSSMRFVDRFQHYQGEDEIRVTDRKKVIILGGGPNRIGQGIEFDYCCVHAAFAAKDLGFESVMINSNPETVSTDYDTSDLLFFEPLTLEDTVNIIERLNGRDLCRPGQLTGFPSKTFGEDAAKRTMTQLRDWGFDGGVVESMMDVHPTDLDGSSGCLVGIRVKDGRTVMVDPHSPRFLRGEGSGPAPIPHDVKGSDRVYGTIVQFGGQTPLNLAHGLVLAGVPIIGTSVDSIDLAEDRNRFDQVLEKLHLHRPPAGIARSIEEAVTIANRIGYPVLLRPSYVLGGRGMEICNDEKAIRLFIQNALKVSDLDGAPVLIDKFLSSATEVDVDVVADGETAIISGVMEHIEHAGIHSGDSAMSIPAYSLKPALITEIKRIGTSLAKELGVRGLMNLQLAIKHDDTKPDGSGDKAYILEVNPRASRTVPFISKAVHVPWPAIAAKVMMGKTLKELGAKETTLLNAYAVKESVFPFAKFPGVDFVLGPEMRSTGEVMGIDRSFPIAFAKSQMAGGMDIPTDPKRGGIFVSVRDEDKQDIAGPVRTLAAIGFTIYATGGTADALEAAGVTVSRLQKIATGARPNVLDLMANKQLALIINTPTKTGYLTDEGKIRATAVRLNIPMISTMPAAHAISRAIVALRETGWGVAALQDYASK